MKTYNVYYPRQIDIASWQSGYRGDSKPDAWPYGLNRLGETGRVAYRYVDRQRSMKAAATAFLATTLGRTRHPLQAEVSLPVTWDERTALDVYLESGRAPYASGIIWATDSLKVPSARLRMKLLHRVLRDTRALWCLSAAQIGVVDDWIGPKSKKNGASYLPFGIDTDFYTQKPPMSTDLIVSVGGDRDRDPKTLYEALASVMRAKPSVTAVVQTTSTLKPPTGVRVVRHINHTELRELYAQAALIAVATKPNLHVSGMTVSLEAAATGRPVVITKTPGMNDYIREGATGFMTPVGEPDAMAQRIISLLQEPEQAIEIGQEGRRHVSLHHTSTTMTRRLGEILKAAHDHD